MINLAVLVFFSVFLNLRFLSVFKIDSLDLRDFYLAFIWLLFPDSESSSLIETTDFPVPTDIVFMLEIYEKLSSTLNRVNLWLFLDFPDYFLVIFDILDNKVPFLEFLRAIELVRDWSLLFAKLTVFFLLFFLLNF